MNVRTYQAPTMAQALAMVKKDLGSAAVILHTRMFKHGGFLGWGGKPRVEITASTDVNVMAPRSAAKAAVAGSLSAAVTGQLRADAALLAPPSLPSSPGKNLLQKTYGSASAPPALPDKPARRAASRNESATTRSVAAVNRDLSASPSALQATTAAPVDPQLNEELKQIRQMVTRMLKNQGHTGGVEMPEKLFNQYLSLLEAEVAQELAEDVIDVVRRSLRPDQLSDTATVRATVSKAVAKLIPVDTQGPHKPRTSDGRPLTIALIGPTGVGKTTTLAKLAATFKLREKLKVALVTIDTYRIAAVDQLRTYANIIGLPLHVVLTPAEMRSALDQCADCDVILIDTAGRSQRDNGKLDQLRQFIDVADPHEVHLVLSSACSQGVLMEAVERFSQIRIDRIIFTKLDEAVNFGVLLNVLRQVNKSLSYITTGQEVPHQIERGASDRLAGLILGEPLR